MSTVVAGSQVSSTIPAPPSKRLAVAGKNPTGAWTRAAHKKLEMANAEVMTSTHLRGESVKANQTLEKQVVDQQKFVNDRLKKRIKECKAYRSKLQTAHKSMASEAKHLTDARDKLQTLKQKFDRQLKLSTTRAQLRSERPAQENIADIASAAIASHTDGIKGTQGNLQGDVDKANNLLLQLNKSMNTLQSDIDHKTQAIDVDLDCLHFDLDSEGKPVQHFTQGSASTSGMNSLLPSAAEGPYAIQKSKTDPDYWKQVSGINLEMARGLTNEAKELRNNMMIHAKKAISSNSSQNSDVMESLSKRKTQTKQFLSLMQQQLNKIDNELATLADQDSQVSSALKDKERPLEIVKKRLEARLNRPGREAVRDEVEIELEKEFTRLVAAVEALNTKQKKIKSETEKLKRQRQAVQDDHDCKLAAFHLENTCIDIDTATEYQLDSRKGSRQGSGLTPRGGTPRGGTPRGASEGEGFLPPISPRTPRGGTPRY